MLWLFILNIYQESTDSRKEGNPFRDDGQLSEYAKNVVNAVQTGNLDQLESATTNQHIDQTIDSQTQEQLEKCDSKQTKEPLKAANKEIKVEHSLVISPRHSDIEHILIPVEKKNKKLLCCVLMWNLKQEFTKCCFTQNEFLCWKPYWEQNYLTFYYFKF